MLAKTAAEICKRATKLERVRCDCGAGLCQPLLDEMTTNVPLRYLSADVNASGLWRIFSRASSTLVVLNFTCLSYDNPLNGLGAYPFPHLEEFSALISCDAHSALEQIASGSFPALKRLSIMSTWSSHWGHGFAATTTLEREDRTLAMLVAAAAPKLESLILSAGQSYRLEAALLLSLRNLKEFNGGDKLDDETCHELMSMVADADVKIALESVALSSCCMDMLSHFDHLRHLTLHVEQTLSTTIDSKTLEELKLKIKSHESITRMLRWAAEFVAPQPLRRIAVHWRSVDALRLEVALKNKYSQIKTYIFC